jgi:Ca2+-binding RTX toxin-like protein
MEENINNTTEESTPVEEGTAPESTDNPELVLPEILTVEPVSIEIPSNISETEVVVPVVGTNTTEPMPIEATSNISETEVVDPKNEDLIFAPTSANNGGNINGKQSNDKLVGSSGNDKIRGLGGDDTLIGDTGNDQIWGGQGADQIFYLQLGEGVDKLQDFASADKLVFNKRIFGNLESASFTSATVTNTSDDVGDASLLNFSQNVSVDELPAKLADLGVSDRPVFAVLPAQGQASQLVFVDGEKVDVIADLKNKTSLQASNFDFFNMTAEGELDPSIWGTPEKDQLVGTEADDTINGLGDNDNLLGNDGDDYLLGGAGNDVVGGQAGNDTVLGNTGDDKVYGNAGDDSLAGGHGFDHLFGGDGKDVLLGGTGGDRLNGGAGNDSLTGGGGKDRFIFNTNESFTPADFGIDNITDFTSGQDLILLDQRSFNGLNSVGGIGFSVATEFAVVNSEAEVAQSAALIVYNQDSGQLFYNQNSSEAGFGTGGQFAVLDNKAVLTSNDFQLRVV